MGAQCSGICSRNGGTFDVFLLSHRLRLERLRRHLQFIFKDRIVARDRAND